MDELFTPLVPDVPQRLCPDCKISLERSVSHFAFSEAGQGLFGTTFSLDIYACPRCGLVRFYSSKQRMDQEDAARKAAQAARPPVSAEKEDIPRPTGPTDPWEQKKGGLFGRFHDKD